jgi:hypothetical protein
MSTTHGKALALAFCDFNDDGRIDFYLANDGTPGDLMQNLGGGRFRNVGMESGAAMGALGQAQAGMGADWADFDGDGLFDLAVSAFSGEPYSVYRNIGGTFEHAAAALGIAEPTTPTLGFGTKFVDADNDGWSDLVFVNGHVYDRAADVEPGSSYRLPTMLFHNQRGERFIDAAASAGEGFTRPIVGRGIASGDFNNDGRPDLLVVDYEGRPLLLRNDTANSNHWLVVDLRAAGNNGRAYGARVEVKAGGRRWVGQVSPASSYLSSSDPRVHFGLGGATSIDAVTVTWPDGQTRQVTPAIDRFVHLEQPGAGREPLR